MVYDAATGKDCKCRCWNVRITKKCVFLSIPSAIAKMDVKQDVMKHKDIAAIKEKIGILV